MSLLDTIVDGKGRVNYQQLCAIVDSYPIEKLLEQGRYPFFVGKELYEGEMTQRKDSAGGASGFQTMRFNVSGLRNHGKGASERKAEKVNETTVPSSSAPNPSSNDGISRAIYMLRKSSYSTDRRANTVLIGRNSENDIVIADYVISKKHAQLVVHFNDYCIVDTGSTNGTRVNGELIPVGVKIPIQPLAEIGLGRICFIFMPPSELFATIRAVIGKVN